MSSSIIGRLNNIANALRFVCYLLDGHIFIHFSLKEVSFIKLKIHDVCRFAEGLMPNVASLIVDKFERTELALQEHR